MGPEAERLLGTRIAILGCGSVGSALALDLVAQGASVLLWSRTPERARQTAEHVLGGLGTVVDEPEEALAAADATLMAIADPALASFAGEVALRVEPTSDSARAVLHTNGSLGPEILAPLAAKGFGTGKLHPLVAVASDPARSPGTFVDAWFATAGEGSGVEWATRIVRGLAGRELRLGSGDASLRLHAAASLLSGGVVALFDLAMEVLGDATRDTDAARAALLFLLHSTARNVEWHGARDGLTGPISRGACNLVRAHLETLEGEALEAYLLLGRRMLALARARGSVTDSSAVELARLFGDED